MICMVELGQLETQHAEFTRRGVRVIAVSDDDVSNAKLTQDKFPHLVIVSDAERTITKAMDVMHPGGGQYGKDTNAPTTFLIDGTGTVRWLDRPKRFLTRIPTTDLLAAIDKTWP